MRKKWLKNSVLWSALGALTLASAVSRAETRDFALVVDPSLKDPALRPALESFARQAESALPRKLKAGIGERVTLKFIKLGTGSEIVPPSCPGEKSQRLAGEFPLGRFARTGFFGGGELSIELNRAFLPEILGGEGRSRGYGCGHRTLYRLALATALHELSHVYDRRNLPATPELGDPVERDLRARCALRDRSESALESECSKLEAIRMTVSDRPAYLDLMGFRSGAFSSRSKNTNRLRSPDPYEFASPLESFAVNMEYFLLDPGFACRRPSVHQFLKEHFGEAPASDCRVNAEVRNALSRFPVDLDPERVYQIHYLLADRGEELSSRWGHAMFRIVACAPGRPVGPDCIKDIGHHPVVSFRANINDVVISNLKGLMGDYPSQLYFFSMPQIVSEYTLGESRDLVSVPIRLTRDQIRSFVHRAIELHWEYQGRYAFIGNNCATEAKLLLDGALRGTPLEERETALVTPRGVYSQLAERGLLDESVLSRKDASERYRFRGFRHQVAESFRKIHEAAVAAGAGEGLTLERLTRELDAASRKALYSAILSGESPDSRDSRASRSRLAVQFLFLELRIREVLKEKLREEAGRLTLGEARSDSGIGSVQLRPLVDEALRIERSLAPWNLARGGYGIPTDSERVPRELLDERVGALHAFQSKVTELTRLALKDLFAGLNGCAANISFFTSEVKSEMKVSPNPPTPNTQGGIL